MSVPPWVGYGIVVLALAGVIVALVRAFRAEDSLNAEFLTPPETLYLKVQVRGCDNLVHFANCWNQATTMLAGFGPWKREQLFEKLGPGPNKVQVMAGPKWFNAQQKLVGGEYINGVLFVGPNLDVLCHELAHRCEDVFEHTADNEHATWKERGIAAADEAYRAWLKALTV